MGQRVVQLVTVVDLVWFDVMVDLVLQYTPLIAARSALAVVRAALVSRLSLVHDVVILFRASGLAFLLAVRPVLIRLMYTVLLIRVARHCVPLDGVVQPGAPPNRGFVPLVHKFG